MRFGLQSYAFSGGGACYADGHTHTLILSIPRGRRWWWWWWWKDDGRQHRTEDAADGDDDHDDDDEDGSIDRLGGQTMPKEKNTRQPGRALSGQPPPSRLRSARQPSAESIASSSPTSNVCVDKGNKFVEYKSKHVHTWRHNIYVWMLC